MADKKRILLIEDDIFLRELCTIKLEKSQYSVDVAADGTQGLALLQSKSYDLVLLDIMLPEINGFEVLEKYISDRQEGEAKPYIMMMTNLSEKEQIDKAKDLGADDYIVKAHYSPTEIVKRVNEILQS